MGFLSLETFVQSFIYGALVVATLFSFLHLSFTAGVYSLLLLILFDLAQSLHLDTPLEKLIPQFTNKDSKWLDLDGVKVHYRDQSPEKVQGTIVMLHGHSSSLHTWEYWAKELLKSGYRVVSLDLPGFGLTGPHPLRDYSLSFQAGFLSKFLEKLEVKKATMIGSSMGGGVCWLYTIQHPTRVDKLVLVGSVGPYAKSTTTSFVFKVARIPVLKTLMRYYTPKHLFESNLRRAYFNPKRIAPNVVDRYFHLMMREGNRDAFLDSTRDPTLFSEQLVRYRDQLKQLKHPALLMWGEADALVPISVAHRLYDDLQNSQLLVFTDAGHVPNEEIAEYSVHHVLQFLESTQDDADLSASRSSGSGKSFLLSGSQ
eukprot:TRINITY_DN3420_c0_g1_i1.p1 TRINITY_DN3420_c0_g1~~TRINITY_DN3420_c0_g1_i1.p1  ORF type:complete len:370 (+),score=106.94 TRINITY_DN3420_c0_g1_i1:118-1227(+)